MTSILLYNKSDKSTQKGDWDLFEKWEKNSDTLMWINIDEELSDVTVELLQQKLKLHPLGIQDAKQNRHPPKIEAFDNHTLIIYKALPYSTESIDSNSIQISMFIGERFLLTRHSDKSQEINALENELLIDSSLFKQGVGAISTRLSRLIVNRYLKSLLLLEERLEILEKDLMGDTGEKILSELISHKSNLTYLERVFYYHSDVSKELTKKIYPGFSKDDKHRLVDVDEQQTRGLSLTSMYYRLASDLVDGYISVSSHRLNQIMKILTIVTSIFIPLGFLAGLYGMNFEYIPELKYHWGYFILLGVMATIAFVLMMIFRRKKWL